MAAQLADLQIDHFDVLVVAYDAETGTHYVTARETADDGRITIALYIFDREGWQRHGSAPASTDAVFVARSGDTDSPVLSAGTAGSGGRYWTAYMRDKIVRTYPCLEAADFRLVFEHDRLQLVAERTDVDLATVQALMLADDEYVNALAVYGQEPGPEYVSQLAGHSPEVPPSFARLALALRQIDTEYERLMRLAGRKLGFTRPVQRHYLSALRHAVDDYRHGVARGVSEENLLGRAARVHEAVMALLRTTGMR